MSAYEIWLRTGRNVKSLEEARQISYKFNPWHDPHNGQFTTSGAGVQSQGSAAMGAAPHRPPASHNRPFVAGGGSAGGGGAQASWEAPQKRPLLPPQRALPTHPAIHTAVIHAAVTKPKANPHITVQTVATRPIAHRRIENNGYHFEIDHDGRTLSASGQIRLDNSGQRSRTSQSRAGGTDRKLADDGGHYIAARFSGPTEKFNHFAQDRNFNRGAYRSIEDGWAKSVAQGHKVTVNITPHYTGHSQRLDKLVIHWAVDGHPTSLELGNRPKGN